MPAVWSSSNQTIRISASFPLLDQVGGWEVTSVTGILSGQHCSKGKCYLLKLPSFLPSDAFRLMVRKVEGCESFQFHLQHQDMKKNRLGNALQCIFSQVRLKSLRLQLYLLLPHGFQFQKKIPSLWSSWEVAMSFLPFLHPLPRGSKLIFTSLLQLLQGGQDQSPWFVVCHFVAHTKFFKCSFPS